MKSRYNIAIITLLVLFIFSVFGYFYFQKNQSNTKIAPEKKVKVVVLKDLYELNFIVDYGLEYGIFQKNGLKVEKINVMGGTDKMLTTKGTDFVIGGLTGPLSSFYNGQNHIYLANTMNTFNSYGLSRFDEKNYDQIKNVGISKIGTDIHTMTILGLKNLGIDYKEVNFVAVLDSKTKIELLKQGKLDLITDGNPNLIPNFGYVINYDKYFGGKKIIKGIVSTKEYIEKNPEKTQLFITSIYQILEDIKINKTKSISLITNTYGIDNTKSEIFYTNFITNLGKINFLPSETYLDEINEIIIEDFKVNNPKREIKDFMNDTFAKKAIKDEK